MTGRRLLWAGTLLVPADVGSALAGVGDAPLFVISAAALVPLAWVIGESTEQVGEHTGPAIAGLLNASFGNAPELMVALFSVHRGLFEVVRGSLTGSVIGNLLLVLGFSLLVGPRGGGGGSRQGRLGRRTTFLAIGQVALATLAFLIPTAAHWWDAGSGLLRPFALPPMALLLGLYLVTTAVSVRAETRAHRSSGVVAEPHWSLRTGLIVLALATVGTIAATEILTGTIRQFADATGLGDFFVAAVIVAIVGNAAEHGGAVVVASRGNVRLASEIALSSASQVALFVFPVVVFLSLTMQPLPLEFRAAELAGLGAAVVVPAALLADGRTARWKGGALCGAYAGIALLFWAVG